MTKTEIMVRLDGVSKRYQSVTALASTDLEVRTGEFMTLLGPSGSGKTTLLNIIAGMIEPTEGAVWINGREVTRVPPAKRDLGMVFQSYALMPHMTVFDNIAFPLRVRGVKAAAIKQRVERVLELVHLPHLAERRPRELSGGQQQRVSLARCIVYEPSLVLMDEPLGALDKKLREQMQLEIKRLHTKLGITMIYVTHDQDEALTMSDRIMLMNAGRVEQIGSPEEMYFSPKSAFAADFLGQSNLLPVTVVDGATVSLEDAGILQIDTTGYARGDRATLLFRPQELMLSDFHAPDSRPSLEGVLRDTLMVGGIRRQVVVLKSGREITVEELSGLDTRHERGEAVRITWRRAQLLSA